MAGDPHTRRIEANGLSFHVTDSGEGPPVVLLHGFPDTSALWRNQIAALVEAGFRCIAPDMRGRGRSDRPDDVADYALTNMVRDVAGVLDALGVDRAHIVGHDWGAGVAWLFASLMPDRTETLTAISVGFPGA
ncbi:MAG: alpha/beta fold hydrolase, partial [Chloroflexi bacterium]|nr:alpha/beta fold hydrolase [Chloroflexota bacterium]